MQSALFLSPLADHSWKRLETAILGRLSWDGNIKESHWDKRRGRRASRDLTWFAVIWYKLEGWRRIKLSEHLVALASLPSSPSSIILTAATLTTKEKKKSTDTWEAAVHLNGSFFGDKLSPSSTCLARIVNPIITNCLSSLWTRSKSVNLITLIVQFHVLPVCTTFSIKKTFTQKRQVFWFLIMFCRIYICWSQS